MKKNIFIFAIISFFFYGYAASADIQHKESFNQNSGLASSVPQNVPLIHWIRNHVSPRTGLPLSFYVPEAYRSRVFAIMGDENSVPAIIERNIVDEGFVIYDGALWQIVLTALGGAKDDLARAALPIQFYWQGSLKDLAQIRSGYPASNFSYDKENPAVVSSDLEKKGIRGFIFRILSAHGRYLLSDPLDGKTSLDHFPNLSQIHWEDWKPIAGENAWVVLAALHIYHKKYFDHQANKYLPGDDPVELYLAKEISRAAIILQSGNGGVRMAPLGTYRNPAFDPLTNSWSEESITPDDYEWHYNEISTENNLSWYAAFRLLYQVTRQERYVKAMRGIERYLKTVWDQEQNIFHQGMHYQAGQWQPHTEHFAVDVQMLAVGILGPGWIDENFGEGTAYRIWERTKSRAGYFDARQRILGMGYTDEHDRVSVEWTCMSILAARRLAQYYSESHPDWSRAAQADAATMRAGIEKYRYKISDDEAAYAYSSKRGWIPWGWFSHGPQVLSLVSTCWVILIDSGISPFVLPDFSH